jgi:hypothetical protein
MFRKVFRKVFSFIKQKFTEVPKRRAGKRIGVFVEIRE